MKILKIILIVIFALVFAVSGGLLVYSVINPPVKQDKETVIIGDAPALSLYEGGVAKYDVKTIREDEALSREKKATDLMVSAAYNLINIKQFFYNARVDVVSVGSNAFSDYHYTQSHYAENSLNTFKRAQAFTGGDANTYVLRCYYLGQKIEELGACTYDDETETWTYTGAWPTYPKTTDNTQSRQAEEPYFYYSALDFPLDFGGLDAKWVKEGRSEAIDYTVVDPETVEITDNEEEGYYTLKFNARVATLNASEETKKRLSGTTSDNKMTDITFKDFTVTAEIWKDAGVFRTLHYVTHVHASLGSDSGDIEIEKMMKFSYDDDNCSVAKKIMTVKDSKGNATFYGYLKDESKAACDAEVKALADAAAARQAEAAKQEEVKPENAEDEE